ncbi:MAG TPA: universal stress protein [Longimicrobiales bacterium]|nr:universal stress protein [Longimicrobiales bacterium]
MYREILLPVDNSTHSDWAVARAIEIARTHDGHLTANHVYAARLHDVRFRQLETGLPAQFQSAEEIKRQRKVHDKLIEKGLQLISDSFLDQVENRCREVGVPMTRQLLEGINYEEITNEANRGAGRLPSLIGFDPNIANKYDGGERVRSDVRLGEDGRIVAEDEAHDEKLAGSSARAYDLLVMGAHGIGKQPYSQIGGVTARVARGARKDMFIVRDGEALTGGRLMVCVDGSSYAYKGMRVALEMARAYKAKLYVCSAFDVEYHHAVFGNIRYALSEAASKVFKFEEQEELHNNIIDKGLLKLCQANLKRAQVMASEFPDVEIETQILVGKPFQVVLQWIEEVKPSLLILARHGSHRIDGTEMGSQAENLLRLAPCNTLVIGTENVKPDEIPWIEEDGETGLEWTPDAEVRILRVPPFALGIARKAVEEFCIENYSNGHLPVVTGDRLDEAIRKLLPTHMQLIMGIGTAEELALAEVKAEEAMKRTVVQGRDADAPGDGMVEAKCPYTGHIQQRARTEKDPVVWTREAFERLRLVPLIARPLARNTVEKFAKGNAIWRVTTAVMDENKQAMIEADTFDMDTMLVMFKELQSKQLRAVAEGVDGLTPEMRRFIEEAKAAGVTRCPIRDLDAAAEKCPVDLKLASPADAKRAVQAFMESEEPSGARGASGVRRQASESEVPLDVEADA